MGEVNTITVIASREVISELLSLQIHDTTTSEPTTIDNPADVLDSPLNPADIKSGFEMIKVIFETGTAAITFGTALVGILRNQRSKAKISSPQKRRGKVIDENSTNEEVLEELLK